MVLVITLDERSERDEADGREKDGDMTLSLAMDTSGIIHLNLRDLEMVDGFRPDGIGTDIDIDVEVGVFGVAR